MEKQTNREALLNAGAKRLNEYGYANCKAENIVTDAIYKEFFKKMLLETLGNDKSMDRAIKKLLAEIG